MRACRRSWRASRRPGSRRGRSDARDAAQLALVAVPGAAGEELAAGRDGWSARLRPSGAGLGEGGGREAWLRAADGRLLVARAPGEVQVALAALATPPAEAAAF